jgi:hypothetical protein
MAKPQHDYVVAYLKAVERLYDAFSTYPKSRKLDGSEHRNLDNILKDITSVPLRALTELELGSYPLWATTTVGTIEDYKHFLPRIFDLVMRGGIDDLSGDPAGLAHKLNYNDLRTWPKKEQEAILEFFKSAFLCAYHGSELTHSAYDNWMECLIALQVDVASLLESVAADKPTILQNYAMFIQELLDLYQQRKSIPVDVTIPSSTLDWMMNETSIETKLRAAIKVSNVQYRDDIDLTFQSLQAFRANSLLSKPKR